MPPAPTSRKRRSDGFFQAIASNGFQQIRGAAEGLTWILIYGGLLTLVLGLWVEPIDDDDTGWFLVAGGGLAAAVGLVMIYVRSRIKTDS